MKSDLSPEVVAARLAALRGLYVPETLEEGRARVAHQPVEEPFERSVARRLAELRALCELTSHLQRAGLPRPTPGPM